MKSQLEDLTYLEFRERLKDDPVITDHTRNGIVSGDATLASAEAGRLFSEYIVERTAKLVDYLKTIKQSGES